VNAAHKLLEKAAYSLDNAAGPEAKGYLQSCAAPCQTQMHQQQQ